MAVITRTVGPDHVGRYALRRWTVIPATYLVAIVAPGLTVVPLLFVVVDGFRTNGDINAIARLPHPWVAGNYTAILTSAAFWQFLGNSFLIAAVATALTLILGSMAALALSRYEFKGREVFYTVFVSGLLFPLGVGALPLYLLLQRLGLLDNQFGVAIPEAAFGLPITLIILRPFLRAIPGELQEAALVDGASRFRFFAQPCSRWQARARHGGPARLRAKLGPVPAATAGAPDEHALHPAAGHVHLPDAVLAERRGHHGVHGDGDGPRAGNVPVRPAVPGGWRLWRREGIAAPSARGAVR